MKSVYEIVRKAQFNAIEKVKPGIRCSAVDDAARKIINESGYGEFFIHRTGHGIGMEYHEEPYIVAGNDTILQEGMALSIEPGIYNPN